MKHFVTWGAVAFLVAVAVLRWRRVNEPIRQAPGRGGEKPAAPDPAVEPAGRKHRRRDPAGGRGDGT